LLTYAAGLEAVTVVWVAGEFTDEHRAALDWLNSITDTRFDFFGLEVELWRIGDSPLAPKFNVVSKPNDWSKALREPALAAQDATDTQQLHLEFWTQFREYMERRGSPVRLKKPRLQHWTPIAIGRSDFQLIAWNGMRDGRSGVHLRLSGLQAKMHCHILLDRYEAEVERQLGPVEWRELPERQESQIGVVRESNPADPDTWPELNRWFADTLERWQTAFAPIVRTIDASEYQLMADEADGVPSE
jgi:hypothetical protein